MFKSKNRKVKKAVEDAEQIPGQIEELKAKRKRIYDTLKDMTLCSIKTEGSMSYIQDINKQILFLERKYKKLTKQI